PYDGLDRPTVRRYSDGTPAVTFGYDTPGNKGRLTSVSSSVSATSYDYDALGRIKESTQTIGGQTYTFSYEYDRAGQMTKQIYPSGTAVPASGKTVDFGYDQAGRLNAITGYASQMAYSPHGALNQVQLASGLWENARYNCRLQPMMIGLGATPNSTPPQPSDSSSLKLEFNYRSDKQDCTGTSNDNNGNVRFQNITVPDLLIPGLAQSFTYDGFSRLKTAGETGNGAWSQTYEYDQYGNRWLNIAASYGISISGHTPTGSNWYDAATNRMAVFTGFQYDPGGRGNQTQDPSLRTFAYDAENRMISDSITISGTTYTNQYHYDGDGRRVKKVVGSNTTVYVYNAMGQLAAEYESPRQATNGGRRYLTADHLGSTRLITDEVGAERSRHDYLPFGEDLPVGVGGRQGSGYGDTAGVNQQFTGKERDAESGLDYFLARYFSGTQGRFLSVDSAGPDFSNPQTFNKYTYVNNNP
ncbi:MAG: RHS repeat-associated core domain-containing protein, partial [Gammaproteobacteria bacterium]